MSKDKLLYLFNWQLNQEAFRHEVRKLINRAEKEGKVLALPIKISPGQQMLDMMTLLLSQVNCDGCDARCCKIKTYNKPIEVLPPEYERLAEKYGSQHFKKKGEVVELHMPCPFLKNNRCSIYRDRPLVCVLYPYQFGANDVAGNMVLAMSSSCPEARRITRNIYMWSWRLRHQFQLLGEENFLKGIL